MLKSAIVDMSLPVLAAIFHLCGLIKKGRYLTVRAADFVKEASYVNNQGGELLFKKPSSVNENKEGRVIAGPSLLLK